MKLGKYFTLDEMTASQTATRRGIRNAPSSPEIANLRALVQNVLDPLREHYGKPVVISSGFRSVALNRAVGGASTSQYVLGEAADLTIPGVSVANIVATIRQLKLPFDQLIDEYGDWVHVSYSPRHRRQVLVARKINGKTVYAPA